MSTLQAHAHPDAAGVREAHDHEWHLADGTGLHAPIGTLIRDPESGRACCHICGDFFTFLGAHIRVHGYSAAEYRRVMGLGRTAPLTAPSLSAAIARRQKAQYDAVPKQRDALAFGHAMARSGDLAALARRANIDPRPQTLVARSEALAAGRTSRASAAEWRAAERLGVEDLPTWLADQQRCGATLTHLASIVERSPQWVRRRIRATATTPSP